jgi:hypothetical protein
MRVSNNEAGGRLSTADLAAAGRHADSRRDEAEEYVSPERDPDPQLRTSQAEGDGPRPPASSDAAKDAPDRPPVTATGRAGDEALVALFTPQLAETYRSRWIAIQSGFVDDPKQAVRDGDELVAEVMTNLANTFADERHKMEAQLDQTGAGSTENLRVALRRYRSFFERLLAL